MSDSTDWFPRLIGLSGKAGAGKDTVADIFRQRSHKVSTLAFAAPLKEACASLFGVDSWYFYDRNVKEQPIPGWGVSPRQIAQYFGTEIIRKHLEGLIPGINSDFWWKRAEFALTNRIPAEGEFYTRHDVVIITDVRFQNEYDWIIRKSGHHIHIERTGVQQVGIPNHASERGFDFHTKERTHVIVNNGTLPELTAKALQVYHDIEQALSN